MAKTVAPGTIQIAGADNSTKTFEVNVLPDPFDERDLAYRPRLQPLLDKVDQHTVLGFVPFVMEQKGQSCTGHAVSAVMNTVIAQSPAFRDNGHSNGTVETPCPRISAYMLYHLGRRYDEFPGEADIGSSLRGVFKGWFHHGVLAEEEWNLLDMDPEPDYNHDDATKLKCRHYPLGAYYRVNPYSLDDMQSAINELYAVAASARIHTGWENPIWKEDEDGKPYCFIDRKDNPEFEGGHAFALVGYNELGFLVQNSWGEDWGDGGFAILPYDDWLDNAYDAWVARMGVPKTPFASGRKRVSSGHGGSVSTVTGLDEKRLSVHVVNTGNNGILSTQGKATSSPHQISRVFQRMDDYHRQWHDDKQETRHIILYAHGGLVSQETALATAESHLNWWLNNHVYPIYFVWESGAIETVLSKVKDILPFLPAAAGKEEQEVEQWDRRVELIARPTLKWAWDEMKENGRKASGEIRNPEKIRWENMTMAASNAMAQMPGASLVVHRLKKYIQSLAARGIPNVAVHLVGHSGGTVFHAALLQQLIAAGIAVESVTFMAGGLRVDEFRKEVLPHIGKEVGRFTNIVLSEKAEEDDTCSIGWITLYNKSMLWLVSRAFESFSRTNTIEEPLIGMMHFLTEQQKGAAMTLQSEIEAKAGKSSIIVAGKAGAENSRSTANHHVDFDNDPPTMKSVLMRILDTSKSLVRHTFNPKGVDLLEVPPPFTPVPPIQAAALAGGVIELDIPMMAARAADAKDVMTAPENALPELSVAPRTGSPLQDVLNSLGWTNVKGKPSGKAAKKEPQT